MRVRNCPGGSSLWFPLLLQLSLLISLLCLTGCGKHPAADAQPGAGGKAQVPEVNVMTTAPRTVPVQYDFAAQVAGSREVEIRARVSGIIQKRNFVEGTVVKAGQSLFLLDAAPYQAALARAQAETQVAEARVVQARRQAQRMQRMLASNSVAQRDFDDAQSAAAVAVAELKAAQARQREAALNLDYTRVLAPISGIAAREQRSEGSYVRGPEDLLTTVTQIDPIYVWFGIPDREEARFRQAVAAGRLSLPSDEQFIAEVVMADGTRYPDTGKVTFNDVRINPATGTSEARAVLANPQGVLRSGQFVRLHLLGAKRVDAIVVPQRSVIEGPQGKMVMTVDAQDKVVPRPVTVGDWVNLSDEMAGWVIDQGLSAGERVIVDGIFKAMPGTQVKPIATAAPGGSPARG